MQRIVVRRRLQEVFGLSWHAHISLLHFGQPALYLINDLYSLYGLSALEQKHITGHFEQLTVNIWFHLPSKNTFGFSTFGWTMQIYPHSLKITVQKLASWNISCSKVDAFMNIIWGHTFFCPIHTYIHGDLSQPRTILKHHIGILSCFDACNIYF